MTTRNTLPPGGVAGLGQELRRRERTILGRVPLGSQIGVDRGKVVDADFEAGDATAGLLVHGLDVLTM